MRDAYVKSMEDRDKEEMVHWLDEVDKLYHKSVKIAAEVASKRDELYWSIKEMEKAYRDGDMERFYKYLNSAECRYDEMFIESWVYDYKD